MFFSVNGDERIFEGNCTINGDTVTVENSLYFGSTKIVVDDISPKSLKLTVLFNYYPFTLFDKYNQIITVNVSFMKTDETPTEKLAGLDGIVYTEDLSIEEKGVVCQITRTNTIEETWHCIRYFDDCHGNGLYTGQGMKYFIYMAPYLYTSVGTYDGLFQPNTPVLKFIRPQ